MFTDEGVPPFLPRKLLSLACHLSLDYQKPSSQWKRSYCPKIGKKKGKKKKKTTCVTQIGGDSRGCSQRVATLCPGSWWFDRGRSARWTQSDQSAAAQFFVLYESHCVINDMDIFVVSSYLTPVAVFFFIPEIFLEDKARQIIRLWRAHAG